MALLEARASLHRSCIERQPSKNSPIASEQARLTANYSTYQNFELRHYDKSTFQAAFVGPEIPLFAQFGALEHRSSQETSPNAAGFWELYLNRWLMTHYLVA
jgi:hypothetical protein